MDEHAFHRSVLESMWRRNECDLRMLLNAIASGRVPAEAYESRIEDLELQQDALEFELGKEFPWCPSLCLVYREAIPAAQPKLHKKR